MVRSKFLRWVWKCFLVILLPGLLLMLDPLLGVFALLGVIIRVISIWVLKKKGYFKKSKFLFAIRVVCWAFLFALGIILNLDAPTIENDYTIDDFQSAGPDADYSFHLIESLTLNDNSEIPDVIGLTVSDANSIEALNIFNGKSELSSVSEVSLNNDKLIERAWGNAVRGKKAINLLSEFDEIADLTKPSLYDEMHYLESLKILTLLYSSYAMLQCEKGNYDAGINELIKIDGIIRKLSINSRSLIMRLVCLAGMSINTNCANHIANHPEIPHKNLKILTDHFSPINEQHISLQNALIAECMLIKTGIIMCVDKYIEPGNWYARSKRFLKINSARRLNRNLLIKAFKLNGSSIHEDNSINTVWPWRNSELIEVSFDDAWDLPFSYEYYNPIGTMTIQILTAALEKITNLHTKLQIQDDLLQIVFDLRLGREVDLSARAYGDEYVIDLDEEMIYSPGVDGVAFTDDDIKLYINPVVLGLK